MKDYSTFTEAKLRAAHDKASAESSQVTHEMIVAGRGHELSSETLRKSRLPDADELTLRFAHCAAVCGAIHAEKERRMTWHGSLKRIKSAA